MGVKLAAVLMIFVAGVMSALSIAAAADLLSLDVVREDRHILVNAEIRVMASPAAVYAALIDYDNFSLWSRRYKSSSYIENAPDGSPQARSDIEGCVLFFCRMVSRVVRLDLQPPEYIRATADTTQSDVLFGVEEWWIAPDGDGSVVRYAHAVEFDFWVPPVIGVWAIKHSLKGDGIRAAERIEAIANE